jgi:hypothetical protein
MNLSDNFIEIKNKESFVEVSINGSQHSLTTMLYSAMKGNSVLGEIMLAACSFYVTERIEQEQKARLN